ncbi:MAG: ABC transporter ATP-binding protein [Eubacteriales bacterium]|nr:ABC transporter ATP-binding protein [Eubacteriales bacterium]MDD4134867.1 ABC transporter ATP-binding protein [Eubacteriales bacterium]
MPDKMLELDDITMQFGGVVAVNNLSMFIDEGEIVALIGPNGAGKTTAFNCVTGVYKPTNGQVKYQGQVIVSNHPAGKMKALYAGENRDKYPQVVDPTPDKITRMGIGRTFQNIRLFKTQTVFENVLIATHLHRTSNPLSAAFRINWREERRMRELSLEMLDFVGLAAMKDELATSLPYGKQRRLEIARALATKPKLLLLDEPAAGMNPQETADLGRFIVEIKERFGLTIFLIEHHMDLVMDISERIYVIDFGKLIAHGEPHEIQDNPDVITAYLGVEDI